MANIQSQIKRNRQNEKRRARNRSLRSELKTRAKNAIDAATAGDAAAAEEALRIAQRRIDMAAARGAIHKNAAARHKGRLTKQVRDLLG